MAALITFASPAAASVIMYAEHARMLLRCAGRDENDAQGIFTAEQLPAAIAALRAAVEAAKQRDAGAQAQSEAAAEAAGQPQPAFVPGLAVRAWPLLELMERARKKGKPVTWGAGA